MIFVKYLRFTKIVAAIAIFFSLITIWVMAIWSLSLDNYEAPQIISFLGRFHPLILHLPIGLMALAIILDILRVLPKSWGLILPKSTWLHVLTTLTATLAVIHGILLFISGGYDGSALAEKHLIGACVFTSIIGITAILMLLVSWVESKNFLGLITTFIAFITLSIASHDGASLTHGEKYLSQYAPNFLKPILEPGYEEEEESEVDVDVPIEDKNIYTNVIEPIFERTCMECHKESKSKGKLRMDAYELLLVGGNEGPSLVPHSIEDSLIIQRINLPLEDDEHMPPEGKPQNTSQEIAILEWWISIGAPVDGSLQSHQPPAQILSFIKGSGDEVVQIVEEPKEKKQEVDIIKLNELVQNFNQNHPGQLAIMSKNSDALIYTSFSDPQDINDNTLKALSVFGPQLQDVSLSQSKITNQGLIDLLKVAPHIKALSLNNCAIGDQVTDELLSLKQLESLNLYGTEITDKSVRKILSIETLNSLYLANTNTSKELVREMLEKKIPLRVFY